MATERKQVDWEGVEIHYRAGIRTLKDIGKEYGVSDAGILKKAKVKGWTRDLQARADRAVPVSAPESDEFDTSGFVYGIFIDTGLERLFKVGMSKHPGMRLESHQISLPFEAKIGIAYFVPNMRREEKELHQMFRDKLVRGEWYRLGDADLDAFAMRSRLV